MILSALLFEKDLINESELNEIQRIKVLSHRAALSLDMELAPDAVIETVDLAWSLAITLRHARSVRDPRNQDFKLPPC
jgi:hypothetical protein